MDYIQADQKRTSSALVKTEIELEDFKKNKTLEAYFARFRFIPREEDRRRLIKEMEEFLASESTFKHA